MVLSVMVRFRFKSKGFAQLLLFSALIGKSGGMMAGIFFEHKLSLEENYLELTYPVTIFSRAS